MLALQNTFGVKEPIGETERTKTPYFHVEWRYSFNGACKLRDRLQRTLENVQLDKDFSIIMERSEVHQEWGVYLIARTDS